jgi:hypothetical protein
MCAIANQQPAKVGELKMRGYLDRCRAICDQELVESRKRIRLHAGKYMFPTAFKKFPLRSPLRPSTEVLIAFRI